MKVHFVTTSREYVDEKAGVWRIMDAVPNVGDQIEFSIPEQKKLERETPFLVVNTRAFLADNCVVCEVDEWEVLDRIRALKDDVHKKPSDDYFVDLTKKHPEPWEGVWSITDDGSMLNLNTGYEIEGDRLCEDDWLLHEIGRQDMNAFVPAYFEACKRKGIKELKIKTQY